MPVLQAYIQRNTGRFLDDAVRSAIYLPEMCEQRPCSCTGRHHNYNSEGIVTMSQIMYQKGSWVVKSYAQPDGSGLYYLVCDTNESFRPIEAVDFEAAKRIADCLADDAV